MGNVPEEKTIGDLAEIMGEDGDLEMVGGKNLLDACTGEEKANCVPALHNQYEATIVEMKGGDKDFLASYGKEKEVDRSETWAMNNDVETEIQNEVEVGDHDPLDRDNRRNCYLLLDPVLQRDLRSSLDYLVMKEFL